MPQTGPERAARWPDDAVAIQFLRERGFLLQPDWSWCMPLDGPEGPVDPDEDDALLYLIEEWDFDGLRAPHLKSWGAR